MSGVNVEFYKAQLLKQADQLDQRLLSNGPHTTQQPHTCVGRFGQLGVQAVVGEEVIWRMSHCSLSVDLLV